MPVFLIPSYLYENVTETIPPYVLGAIKQCQVFFVENERSARRFLKSLWKEMVIDDYQWYPIHKAEETVTQQFVEYIKKNLNIGIISEAGCPGIADPGQILVAKAQELNAVVKPLVGPSSILLSLMASGLNGQSFKFNGYLPIDASERKKALKQLEDEAIRKGTTQIFIETPYRNDALLKDIIQSCQSSTRLCIAMNITAGTESIQTKTVVGWKKAVPVLGKNVVVFLIGK